MASPAKSPVVDTGGPWFEDLSVGDVFDDAPSLTITDAHAAVHQAIVGDRLRLALDAELSRRVVGEPRALVHPALVCDVAIGQSTSVTRRVIANLFYRGLTLRRMPLIGDTLHTTTEVVALRQNSAKPGRRATGLAVLRITTVDQHGRSVLDYLRCAMLPLRDPEGQTGHADDLEVPAPSGDGRPLHAAVEGWKLAAFRDAVHGPFAADLEEGTVWEVNNGDVVTSAPELARLSLNIAAAHHDRRGSGRRLVYGGHTIGIAAAQASRAIPSLVTVVAWHECQHTAPVFEGDTLTSRLTLERLEPVEGLDGGALAHLRSVVDAHRESAEEPSSVLDWRFVAVIP